MRNEILREHCLTYKEYKAFYEDQAQRPNLSSLRKGNRAKPIIWAIKEVLKKKPCPVLDIGCQHGTVELVLAALWYDVCAIDVSDTYIEKSRINTEVVNGWVNYFSLPVEQLSRLGMKFDIILCLSVLEHVADFDKAWNAILDSANDNALILSVVPLGLSFMSEEHVRIFDESNVFDYFPKEAEVNTKWSSGNIDCEKWLSIKYTKVDK